MKLEFDLKDGDVLEMNSKTWFIEEDPENDDMFYLNPQIGEKKHYDRGEIQELLSYSGEVRVIRSEFLSVVDI
jgi:hypothetical protein